MDFKVSTISIKFNEMLYYKVKHKRNFVVKCEGDSMVWNQHITKPKEKNFYKAKEKNVYYKAKEKNVGNMAYCIPNVWKSGWRIHCIPRLWDEVKCKISYLSNKLLGTSDVVETVTSETRPRPVSNFETETENETRDLTFSLMVIKANSLKNAAEKYLECCQIPR